MPSARPQCPELTCLLPRLRYVACEIDPIELATTPSSRDGARKVQVIEAADGNADHAGINFGVPEHPPAAGWTEMPGEFSPEFRSSGVGPVLARDLDNVISVSQYAPVLKALPVILWHSMQLQQCTRNGSFFKVIDS